MSSQTHPPNPNPTETINRLLQHYLALLNEYTDLRSTLNTVQTRLFQSLARANFAAERGVRYYGQDYYDERMQASRRVGISFKEEADDNFGAEAEAGAGAGAAVKREGERVREGLGGGRPVFTVGVYPAPEPESGTSSRIDEENQGTGEQEEGGPASVEAKDVSKSERRPESTGYDDRGNEKKRLPLPNNLPTEDTKPNHSSSSSSSRQKAADPLHWFGILTPPPLRQAQGHAIKAVEDIIPRLATLSAEMARVELEVRRARKRRAKAEKAEGRKKFAELEDRMGKVDVGA